MTCLLVLTVRLYTIYNVFPPTDAEQLAILVPVGVSDNTAIGQFPVELVWPGPTIRMAEAAMSTPEVQSVRRKQLKDEVFDFLHAGILAGQYPPGHWLRQEDIATHLGVSMTPVREALDLLVFSGLAERVPYRGVRVYEPSNEEILNAYGLRLLLEGAAARGAALRITDQRVSALHKLLDQGQSLVRLEDMPQARVLSRELHSSIVAASGNPLLHKAYLAVLNAFPDWMLYEQLFRHPELLADSMDAEHREHLRIVDALGNHDPAVAVERTVEHVINRGRELEAYLGIPAAAIDAKEMEILPLFTMGALPESP